MSDFNKDKAVESFLANTLLNRIYHNKFESDNDIFWKRTNLRNDQQNGIDLKIFSIEKSKTFYVDEKAQLNYINTKLPTCAFEIIYYKNEILKEGWLFDDNKITDVYFLINNIQQNKNGNFTDCIIYSIDRKKLIDLLNQRNINKESLKKIYEKIKNSLKNNSTTKLKIENLDFENEGNLQVSNKLAEGPINLVLKLDFLEKNKVANIFKDLKEYIDL